MLRIRLQKPGKSVKRRYHFAIVVIEGKAARDARFTDRLGYYDPSHQLLHIDLAKYQEWVKKGARPSATVASLFKKLSKNTKKTKAAKATEKE